METVTTCRIKDGEGNGLAWVNSVTGNLYHKGKLYEDVEVVWSIPVNSIKIKEDGEVMAWITSEGYFSLFLLDWVPAGSLILDGHAVYLGF